MSWLGVYPFAVTEPCCYQASIKIPEEERKKSMYKGIYHFLRQYLLLGVSILFNCGYWINVVTPYSPLNQLKLQDTSRGISPKLHCHGLLSMGLVNLSSTSGSSSTKPKQMWEHYLDVLCCLPSSREASPETPSHWCHGSSPKRNLGTW